MFGDVDLAFAESAEAVAALRREVWRCVYVS
jgi:hypothetical protein